VPKGKVFLTVIDVSDISKEKDCAAAVDITTKRKAIVSAYIFLDFMIAYLCLIEMSI
jgi:hypothetical protein